MVEKGNSHTYAYTHIYIHIYTSLTLQHSVLVPFSYTILHRRAAHRSHQVYIIMYLSIHPSIHPSIYLSTYLSSHPSNLIYSNPIYPKCSLQDTPISYHSLHSLDWFVWENLHRKPWVFPIKSIGLSSQFPLQLHQM